MTTSTLKVSLQPEPGSDLWVFSACYSRFIFTIKKNNNLQNALRGVSGLKANAVPEAAENNVDMIKYKHLEVK